MKIALVTITDVYITTSSRQGRGCACCASSCEACPEGFSEYYASSVATSTASLRALALVQIEAVLIESIVNNATKNMSQMTALPMVSWRNNSMVFEFVTRQLEVCPTSHALELCQKARLKEYHLWMRR